MTKQFASLAQEKIVIDLAEQFQISAEHFLTVVTKGLSSRLSREMTELEVLSVCTLIKRYRLDPIAGHLYLQETGHGPISKIRPVLTIDGWLALLNGQEEFDGIEFSYSDSMISNPLEAYGADGEPAPNARQVPEWMEAAIFRKDRTRPTVVREYFLEVFQGNEAWRSMGARQLRHKTIIQSARVAFGLGGLFDEDDVQRMKASAGSSSDSGTTVQSSPEPEQRPATERPSNTKFVPEDPAPEQNDGAAGGEDDELLDAAFQGVDASSSDDGEAGTPQEADQPESSTPEAQEGGDKGEQSAASAAQDTRSEETDADVGDQQAAAAPATEESKRDAEGDQGQAETSETEEPSAEAPDAAAADSEDEASSSQEDAQASIPTLEELAETLDATALAAAEKTLKVCLERIRKCPTDEARKAGVEKTLTWLSRITFEGTSQEAPRGMLGSDIAQYVTTGICEEYPSLVSQAA
ncbi:recombinase RecT [Halomonas sp. I5-271120]|uniref:recombinase RecT n=1 Tax=Halomonas sp. I5-271120 TaxID=3061632 RepID=UPI002714FB28|nr:recombinase RecT [Halomonas sp. I5-271120]